jgi:hypothetical protein
MVRQEIKNADSNAHLQRPCGGPNAGNDFSKEACSVFETATKTTGPIDTAEQLVTQVAVTMLDVDESKTRFLRQRCRIHEVINQLLQVIVGQDRRVIRDPKPWIEGGVPLHRARLTPTLLVGTCVPARVSELQPNQQIIGGTEFRNVCIDQLDSQRLNLREILIVDQQLIWIRASIVPNGNRLTTPHQLRTTQSKVSPPPSRQFRWLS